MKVARGYAWERVEAWEGPRSRPLEVGLVGHLTHPNPLSS
jgi:hypothetical protein